MISILHISDMHFVKNADAYNTKSIILREVAEKAKTSKIGQRILIVTGDFHNFSDKDYNDAEEFLNKLISDMELEASKDVFVIPGNHDVGNEDVLQQLLAKDDCDWKNHNEAAIEMIKNNKMAFVSERIRAFRLYCEFVQRLGIYKKPENGAGKDNPAKAHVRQWRGKLNILHLNTALIAAKDEKTNQMADVDAAANDSTWKDFNGNIPAIAIGHNNFFDLKKDQRNQLATTFALHNVSAYLCGDNHKLETNPERQMIRLSSGYHSVETEVIIPNLVAARGIADSTDTFSEVGYCWHQWNEETGAVSVEFRKWTKESRANTESNGDKGSYTMRKSNTHKTIVREPCFADSSDLKRFLEYTKAKYDVVYLFNTKADNVSLFEVYVPTPTNCRLDVTVESQSVKSVKEKVHYSSGATTTTVYSAAQTQFFKEKLDEYVLTGVEYSYPIHAERPLIARATWENGIKKDYWTLNVLDVATMYDKVTLLGKAGTGKSTALRYITVNLIENLIGTRSIDADIQALSNSLFYMSFVPIYIEFRRFADWWSRTKQGSRITISSLEKYILSLIDSTKESFFDYKLNYIFIFDGIDEIPMNDIQVKEAFGHDSLNLFVNLLSYNFPNCKLVFSSRFGEYDNYKFSDFKEVELVQLTKHYATKLIQNIFEVSGRSDVCNPNELIADMQQKGFKDDVILNPMLLSLIASVALEKGAGNSLPNNKSEVLREGIDLLLDRWAVKEEDKPVFFQQFETHTMKEEIYHQLEEFAYYQNENGTISNSSLLKFFLGHSILSDNAREVFNYLSSKVGLIIAEDSTSFKFSHRSFRAYLAAAYIVRQKDLLCDIIFTEIDKKLSSNHETTFLAIDLLFDNISNFSMNLLVLEQIVHKLLSASASDWQIWFAAKIISNRDYLLYGRMVKDQSNDLPVLKEKLTATFRHSTVLPIDKRIECGIILGCIGDERRGVGVLSDGLPEIEWCQVHGGEFEFGIDAVSIDRIRQTSWGKVDFSREKRTDGKPICIKIDDYDIAKYPITVRQFESFLQAEDGYQNPIWYEWCDAARLFHQNRLSNGGDFWGYPLPKEYQVPNFPATFITFFDAIAFCKWLTSKDTSGYLFRLPSEMEREYVMKRNGAKIFEWGDECVGENWTSKVISRNCNAHITGFGNVCPVGAFNDTENAEPVDLTGNTWEWTQSYFCNTLDQINNNTIINVDKNVNLSFDNAKTLYVTNRSGCMYNGVNCLRITFRGRDPILSDANNRHSFRIIRTKSKDVLHYEENKYMSGSNSTMVAEGYGMPVKVGDTIQIIYYIFKNGSIIQSNLNYSFTIGDGTIHKIFEDKLCEGHRVACNIRMKVRGDELFGNQGFFDIINPADVYDVFIHIKDLIEN